jgi:enamine deaminase RidA (YjgF/YER057c/UK114 family)
LIKAKGIPPTERYGHAARAAGNFIFITGGIGIGGAVSDISVFDIGK